MSMGIGECFKVAIGGLAGNKMRSALTMLGVIIGVGAVITMISIGQGAKKQVTSQIQGLGSNLLIVMPGRGFGGGGGMQGQRGMGDSLTNEIWKGLKEKCPSVENVSPESSRNATIKGPSGNTETSVQGVVPGWEAARNTKIESGRMFTEAEQDGAKRVAIIGKTVITDIFNGSDPIGQSIRINGGMFTVVGVLESKGQQGFTDNDDRVLIPLSTLQRRYLGRKTVRTIYLQVRDESLMTKAMDEVNRALLQDLEEGQFSVTNQAEILDTAAGATQTLTMLLAGIAAVSLLVGGIGIMNIMLVSVTERTREIGLRKALGARRFDILLQFIIESVTMSLAGGVIGIILGMGGSMLVSRVAGWGTAIEPGSIVISFFFSAAVGLFFGVYPASKASALNPIEALRYE